MKTPSYISHIRKANKRWIHLLTSLLSFRVLFLDVLRALPFRLECLTAFKTHKQLASAVNHQPFFLLLDQIAAIRALFEKRVGRVIQVLLILTILGRSSGLLAAHSLVEDIFALQAETSQTVVARYLRVSCFKNLLTVWRQAAYVALSVPLYVLLKCNS